MNLTDLQSVTVKNKYIYIYYLFILSLPLRLAYRILLHHNVGLNLIIGSAQVTIV